MNMISDAISRSWRPTSTKPFTALLGSSGDSLMEVMFPWVHEFELWIASWMTTRGEISAVDGVGLEYELWTLVEQLELFLCWFELWISVISVESVTNEADEDGQLVANHCIASPGSSDEDFQSLWIDQLLVSSGLNIRIEKILNVIFHFVHYLCLIKCKIIYSNDR